MTLHAALACTAWVLGACLVALAVLAVSVKAVRRHLDGVAARHGHAVRPLVTALLAGDDVPELDQPAGRGRDRAVESQLIHALQTVRGEAREAAVSALQRRGVPAAARRQLGRRGTAPRLRAAEVLGLAGGAQCTPELMALLEDRSPHVRWAAARALGRMACAAAVPRLLDLADADGGLPAGQVAIAVWTMGSPAIEPLRRGLGHPSAAARCVSADLLGRLEALRATGELVIALRCDESAEVRTAAAGALRRIGSPLALPALVAALDERSPTVVAAAAAALGPTAEPAVLSQLCRLLDSPIHDVASSAAAALVRAGPEGRQRLAEAAGPGALHARSALALAALHSRQRRRSGRARAVV